MAVNEPQDDTPQWVKDLLGNLTRISEGMNTRLAALEKDNVSTPETDKPPEPEPEPERKPKRRGGWIFRE